MKKTILFCFLFFPSLLAAQHSIGVDAQFYPTGIIPTLRFDYQLHNNSYLNIRAGYNFTDRQDSGKQDNEKGGGFGFGFGYEYKSFLINNLSLSLNTNLWFMEINWEETIPHCGVIPPCGEMVLKQSSDIATLQPAIGLAYQMNLNKSLSLKPSLSYGYDLNIKTKGHPVGDGSIFLVGLNISYHFKQ